MSITNDRDRVRLLIGDTDTNDQLFQDDEIAYFLELASNSVLLAAAEACDAAARKYARSIDFATDDQQFKLHQRADTFKALAQELRARAGGVSSVALTKVDGYSTDIPSDQNSTGSTATGRRNFYTNQDRVF